MLVSSARPHKDMPSEARLHLPQSTLGKTIAIYATFHALCSILSTILVTLLFAAMRFLMLRTYWLLRSESCCHDLFPWLLWSKSRIAGTIGASAVSSPAQQDRYTLSAWLCPQWHWSTMGCNNTPSFCYSTNNPCFCYSRLRTEEET